MRPYSPASERNKDPILSVLHPYLARLNSVLEIGSGTGQHAVHLAEHLPHLTWQPSDVGKHHSGIEHWIRDSGLENVRPPLLLDVCVDAWPTASFDAVYSANTAHIMSWREVACMFAGVAKVLAEGGLFLLYGPFSENGAHNAESNRAFDADLRRRNPQMGIRDIVELKRLSESHRLYLKHEHAMPANNRILVWAKEAADTQ